MRKLLLIATVLLIHPALSAGIFSWTDASGNVVYGDSPPDTVSAKSVEPPKLTVLENFANRYGDQNKSSSQIGVSARRDRSSTAFGGTSRKLVRPYKSVKIIAPKAGQSIRANDGDVSIALTTSPKLGAGDKVIIYLNNQQHSVIKSRVTNLSNLDRGEHNLVVEIQNSKGETLIKSAGVSFNVLRNSVITNKNKPYSPYEDDPSQ